MFSKFFERLSSNLKWSSGGRISSFSKTHGSGEVSRAESKGMDSEQLGSAARMSSSLDLRFERV